MSRSWPSRAFLYGSLREAGVDVYAVDEPDEAALSGRRWPRRFGMLLLDVTGFSSREVTEVLRTAGAAGLEPILLYGAFEEVLVPSPLPPEAFTVRKPVSVGEVVRLVCRRARRAGRGRAGESRPADTSVPRGDQ